MRNPVWLIVLATLCAGTSNVSAAVWAWGCQGQTGGQQVIFNRYSLFVVDSKRKLGSVRKLTADKIDDLIKGTNTEFERVDFNDGLESPLAFTEIGDATQKLELTEKSSKKTSRKAKLICGRDETTEIFRKIYRLERTGEAPRDITMQCIEYMLSTRGGRPGC